MEDLVEKKAMILSQGLVKLRGKISQQDLMDWVCIRFLQEYWYLAFLTRILGDLMGIFQDYLRFNFIFLDLSGIMLPSISHKNLGGFNQNYKIQFSNAL